MRFTHTLLLAAFISINGAPAAAQSSASTSTAQAQPAAGSTTGVGEIDVGARFTSGFDDPGRFNSFVDPRSGATLERLRYTRTRDAWIFDAAIDNAGYRDQRYAASIERAGRLKASFEWNQVPLWYSAVSAGPYTVEGPGVLRLSDAGQSAVQGGATVSSAFGSLVEPFDTRSRREIADARLVYSATRDLDLSVQFRSTARKGEMPYSASFYFSNAIEVPATVDTRTNDLNLAAQWSNPRGAFRVAYDASMFNNSVDTLVWDNPLRITDRVDGGGAGPSQGRLPLWPDSSAHTVSASGSLNLPARSKAVAYVSIGSWLQDAELLPHTINTAIQPIPLARSTAEGDARIVSMMYRLSSRPTPTLWLNAQYRLYDYDNQMPEFAFSQYVRMDGAVYSSPTGANDLFSMTRQFADVDASFTPFRFVAFRAGWGFENDDRSHRYTESTTENTARFSIDSTSFSWGSVRLQYEFSTRTGEGLDEQVFSDIGEQESLRQFDISDRNRHRVAGILQVAVSNAVSVSASVSVGQEHRPETAMGLQDNDLTGFSVGVDVVPSDTVDFGLMYGLDNISTLQKSRQADPGTQFDDPRRDWTTHMDEDVHTLSASLNLPRITDRAGLYAMYDYVYSNTLYVYGLAPNSTLAPVEQLPALTSGFHRGSVGFDYRLTGRATLGVGYRLDSWEVSDFSRSPQTLNTPLINAFVNTLYHWAPYNVHTGFVRVRYRW
jgi:MtrB/PioB family decaheme-associated outer membrane protein